MLLPFRFLVAHSRVEMADVRGCPWCQNVTAGSERLEEVALLQNDHYVPHVAVHEMHPKLVLLVDHP